MTSNQNSSITEPSNRIFVGIVYGALVSLSPFIILLILTHDSPMVIEKFGLLLSFGLIVGGFIGAMLFWIKFNTVIRLIGSGLLGLLIGLMIFVAIYYLF